MAMCARCVLLVSLALAIANADDRSHSNDEHEKRWNTPPELTSEQVNKKSSSLTAATMNETPQARFLPFTASFSLGSTHHNAHALSLQADEERLSFSQSSSLTQSASTRPHGTSFSSSQSSSFSAGLNGVSAADSNSYNLNHPIFGGDSHASSNSFAVGQASAASHGTASSGHASSSAQSLVGSVASSAAAASGSGISGPEVDSLIIQPQGHRNGRPMWSNIGPNVHGPSQRPSLTIQPELAEWPSNPGPSSPGSIKLDFGPPVPSWQDQRPQIQISQLRPDHQVYPTSHSNPWGTKGCVNSGGTPSLKLGEDGLVATGCRDTVHGDFPSQNPWDHGQSRPHYRPYNNQPHHGLHLQSRPNGHGQTSPGLQISVASVNSNSNGFSTGQSYSRGSKSLVRFPERNRRKPVDTVVDDIADAVLDLLDLS